MEIYSALDAVWAVDEASETNVKLLLPNRMYEAILTGRWLLSATGTELANRVAKLGAGHSLPTDTSDYRAFEKALMTACESMRRTEYPATARDAILDTAQQAKPDFQNFVRAAIEAP